MNPGKKNVIEFNGYAFEMFVNNMKDASETPVRCGIVAMDHYGTYKYKLTFNTDVTVYGDILSWAVIESNFYKR